MSKRKNQAFRSIRVKLILLLSFSAIVALLISAIVMFSYTLHERKAEGLKTLSQLTTVMGENLKAPIEFDDESNANTILQTLKDYENIKGALIFTKTNEMFSAYTKSDIKIKELTDLISSIQKSHKIADDIEFIDMDNIFIAKPLYLDSEYIGSIYIISDTNNLWEILSKGLFVQLLALLISLVVIIILAFKIQKIFTHPIFNLNDAMQDVAQNNNYDIKIKHQSNDEFNMLFNGFNNMIDTIKKQNSQLENYTQTLNETIAIKTDDINKQKEELENLVSSFEKNVIASKIDLDGIITYVSIAFCNISGYSQEELIGQNHKMMRHDDMPSELFDRLWESIKSGEIWRGEIKSLKKDGGFYWSEAIISPTFDKNNIITGYSAIWHDITSQKEVEDLSINLENKVKEKTKDLNKQLRIVKFAERKQNELFEEVKKTKVEIEIVHKQTRDSIEYASHIQQAIIPNNQQFKNYFSSFFTLWKPRDIVGGDIYLFEELRDENECLLMVIDCTGHGVPGAFVTMLVKAIERQIVSKIFNDDTVEVSPAWILSYFNRKMKTLLKQDNKDSPSNAGFDGGILYFNKKEKIVKYAGAETPLFIVQDDEMRMIKTDRHSVGYKKSDINYEYKEHIIDVSKPTRLYISTDGYLDQKGGDKGFPYGKKRFQKSIEENLNMSMEEQKEMLIQKMKTYQGDYFTVDDSTIIGMEIKL